MMSAASQLQQPPVGPALPGPPRLRVRGCRNLL